MPDEQVSVTCNLFADHLDQQWKIEQFWLDALDLPRERLCKSFVNLYSKYSQKKRLNKLPFGTTRITVHSTQVVQSIFGARSSAASSDPNGWADQERAPEHRIGVAALTSEVWT